MLPENETLVCYSVLNIIGFKLIQYSQFQILESRQILVY